MTAARNRWRTAARFVGVTVVSLPFVGLIETLQLDGTDQSPGTPSLALLIVGAFAGIPLLIPSVAIHLLAGRLRVRRNRIASVAINIALAAAFALVAIYGRGWLGALAAIGVVLQCVVTVAAIARKPAWPKFSPRSGTTTLGDVLTMSERGQAGEALALLNSLVVGPEYEQDFLLAKTQCAYRAGLFEESIELASQIAQGNPDQARVRQVVTADARLSAALRDGRVVTQDDLAECAAAILGPDLPEGYASIGAYAHSRALLALASGDAETAMRAGLEVLKDKSIVPADRAMVIAMVVIAAVRAGDLHVARWWDPKVPDWCPLRPAVDRELGRQAPESTSDDPCYDSDCLIVE